MMDEKHAARSPATAASWQLAAVFLALAGLTRAVPAIPSVVPLLYVAAMLYGTLRLERSRLAILAAFAVVTHGVALFMAIDAGAKAGVDAALIQVGVLALVLGWFAYSSGAILELRSRLSEARSRLHDLQLEADARASHDALTGVYHHRHLMDALEREIARAERIGKPLCIARIDLDWLGSVNQVHGTAAGDVALKRFTAAALEALRDVDVLGRYGGKEFLALLPDTDLKGAVVAAERVRTAVGREPLPEVRGRRHLSCTLGVAEHRKGENTRLVIGRAESALSFAKAAGRDRVVALGPGDQPVGL